jgi:TonB-dependent SusC/RagA subfamily outer membrane receptor
MIKPRIVLILLIALLTGTIVFGQKNSKRISISGVVQDANRYPVEGAVIMIDGNKSGCSTDVDGVYKIKVRSSVKKIGIFTLPPSVIQEPVDGRTTINFTLNDSIVKQIAMERHAITEERVNIGYGSEKRKNLTNSVGKIDGTNPKYASYKTIYDMLRGEIPGVNVTGTSITIREATSLTESNEPLFVVDGVPVNSIDDIEPRMVKSISVLKGPAASIYGTRGSAGVIIITLSGGK